MCDKEVEAEDVLWASTAPYYLPPRGSLKVSQFFSELCRGATRGIAARVTLCTRLLLLLLLLLPPPLPAGWGGWGASESCT